MEEKSGAAGYYRSIALLALFTVLLAVVLLWPERTAEETAPAEEPTAPISEPTANPPEEQRVISLGEYRPSADGVLSLSGTDVDPEMLRLALDAAPEIVRLELPDARLAPADQAALARDYPGVKFLWPVEVLGLRVLSDAEELSFAGRTDLTAESLRVLRDRSALFPRLRTIDLTGCGLADRDLHALDAALPETDVIWTLRIYGQEVCSTDVLIDLHGLAIRDGGAQLEAVLPYLPRLEKVDMCGCGIPDEEMDALDRRCGDVRVVWTVNILTASIRTDADFFIPYRSSGVTQTGINAGYEALQYCPDLIALDVGHSHSRDFSYLANMPHLKYFIMVECYPLDMTPVGELAELEWLEMFQCITRDMTPLLNCRSLRDLNVCYVICPRDNMFETLKQMTWLRRLWCSGTNMTRAQIAALREALPNTEIWCKNGDESTGGTWRYDEDYYDMRDAFHMYYMDITGNRVRRMTEKELQAIHEKFWK